MKKWSIGLTLFVSASAFAFETPSHQDLSSAAARAELATNLWFCDSEEALKKLADSIKSENQLGCDNAIKKAKSVLDTTEIVSILSRHVDQLKMIQSFESEVRSGRDAIELLPAVRILKSNGISFTLLKRYGSFTNGELLTIQFSYEKSKSRVEKSLERL
jgi:hypothetical protein